MHHNPESSTVSLVQVEHAQFLKLKFPVLPLQNHLSHCRLCRRKTSDIPVPHYISHIKWHIGRGKFMEWYNVVKQEALKKLYCEEAELTK